MYRGIPTVLKKPLNNICVSSMPPFYEGWFLTDLKRQIRNNFIIQTFRRITGTFCKCCRDGHNPQKTLNFALC